MPFVWRKNGPRRDMGQVAITLNDRTYRLVCDDGEEDRLVELAGFVKSKVEALRKEVGHVGDERLMLMAALMIADELFDARAALVPPQRLAPSQQETREVVPQPLADHAPKPDNEADAVKKLRATGAKMAAERDGVLPSLEAEAAPKHAGDRARRRSGA